MDNANLFQYERVFSPDGHIIKELRFLSLDESKWRGPWYFDDLFYYLPLLVSLLLNLLQNMEEIGLSIARGVMIFFHGLGTMKGIGFVRMIAEIYITRSKGKPTRARRKERIT
jgi:hypothetical protein